MTDRFYSLTVSLQKNTREDDAQRIMDAISMISGVLSVRGNVASSESYIALERAKLELRTKIMRVLRED